MTTKWYGGSDWFNPGGVDGMDSFEEHAEQMKMFHRRHPTERELMVILLKNMRIFRAVRILTETGGTTDPLGVGAWFSFVPIPKVALYRLSQS